MNLKASLLALIALAGPSRAQEKPPAPPPLAITHVTVIDATGSPAQGDRTVVITGDRITSIGPSTDVRALEGARVVDGTGKFLIPGLWDMHVHWYLESSLPLFVANGVTGVRLMWGIPLHHGWRERI